MPALRALALCLLASMHAWAYEPLTRRRIAGLAAATTLAPRVARADDPAVDAEMIANIQKSRDAWKTNAARRGFAFEAGASMPFVKEGTVGAPDGPRRLSGLRGRRQTGDKEGVGRGGASGLPYGGSKRMTQARGLLRQRTGDGSGGE